MSDKIYDVPAAWAQRAYLDDHGYRAKYEASVHDPEAFWGEEGKRIRMQDLPILSTPAAARPVVATWPANRVSNSQFKTMQWRINDCYRQMRYPEPKFGSEATVALTTYLAVTANGARYRGPGTKR